LQDGNIYAIFFRQKHVTAGAHKVPADVTTDEDRDGQWRAPLGFMKRTARRTSPVPNELVFDVVRPLVRILIACGISERRIRSATERACREYVQDPAPAVQRARVPFLELADVVMVWATDPDFIDETGSPMKLRVAGGRHSFERLLKKVGISIPPASALEHLEALGTVQRCDRGRRVRFVSNVLLAVSGNQFVATPLLDSVRRFLETIEHNLYEKRSAGFGLMQRWAVCSSLDPEQFSEAQRFVRLSGQSFLNAADEKLGSCKTKGSQNTGRPYGIGIYAFLDRERRAPVNRRTESRSHRYRQHEAR